jgi:hypothetical protein
MTHRAALLELQKKPIQELLIQTILDGHTHMHLARANQIHHDTKPIQSSKHTSKEAMRDVFPIGVNIENHDVFFDGHGRRHAPVLVVFCHK